MNWRYLRPWPWLDTRAGFISHTPHGGRLLDLGASDGETLGHMAELRPDLRLAAADKHGKPENYPAGCEFQRTDFERDPLPWPDATFDTITCMHVVEHLNDIRPLLAEVARLLKPGSHAYFETPHSRTLSLPSAAGKFTLNFFDDPTHTKLVEMTPLAESVRQAGLVVETTGVSRNWLFAAAHPVFCLLPESRKKFTARVHWLGWSAYLVARRPA